MKSLSIIIAGMLLASCSHMGTDRSDTITSSGSSDSSEYKAGMHSKKDANTNPSPGASGSSGSSSEPYYDSPALRSGGSNY